MSFGIIKRIEEVSNDEGMEGYKITTDKTVIKCYIDNFQSCCEDSGYMCSNDDINEFMGAEIRDVYVTDEALKTLEIRIGDTYNGGATFVNVETDKGTFQMAVYNSHNGYYAHDIKVQVNNEVIASGYL